MGTSSGVEKIQIQMEKQMEKLKILEEEKGRVVEIEDDDIEETTRDNQNIAVCKILTNRTINGEMFSEKIPKIWSLEGKVEIEKAGKNTFLHNFKKFRDKSRVVMGGPWSFDNAIMLFEDLKGGCSIEEIEFRYVPFWVHFHNLPRVCFCRKYAEALGNSIGIFEIVDLDDQGKIKGETLRVRVRIGP